MSKKLFLLILFLGVMLAITGCFGNTPPPEPKGDTLTQEQLNELFPKAHQAFSYVFMGLGCGPDPDGLNNMSSPSIKQSSKQPSQIAATSLTWTGPDSGGWYQTGGTFGPPGGISYEDVIKFRYFSKTGIFEIKIDEKVKQDSTVIKTVTSSFHGSQGNNKLWSGNENWTTSTADMSMSETIEINFSDVSDINCSGIFDAWFKLTGPNPIPNHQYAHYVLVYDPTGAPSPDTPYHLTGWHENPSNTLDQWVKGPPYL